MKPIIFKGKDSFAIGTQFGKIYKKNGFSVDWITINKTIYSQQLKIYKKYFPSFLDELRGIAIAGGYDLDMLQYSFIGNSVEWMMSTNRYTATACSVFGLKKGTDLFVGRNYDWLPETEKVFCVYKTYNPKNYAHISVSDMNIYKKRIALTDQSYLPVDALNEHGLYIGLTASINNDWAYGLSSMHMIKLVAETCKNVAEAVRLFKKVPLNCAKNFFIADAQGNMVVVEHFSGLNLKIVKPKDDLLIQTNHYNDPEFSKQDKILLYRPTNTTFLRYYEILREVNLRKKTFKQKHILEILNKEGSLLLQNTPTARSIWTLSFNMTKKQYVLHYDLFGKKKSLRLKI
ncbi:MAG: C45 family peptidase [Candidatus Pacebacteria bacterium]|jgi:predicted choloylglycine hydrolase|nr:C45 family peptidase [Candidatus Paceibacterota bacterium]